MCFIHKGIEQRKKRLQGREERRGKLLEEIKGSDGGEIVGKIQRTGETGNV